MPVGDVLPEIAVIVSAVLVLLWASFAGRARQWVGAPIALAGIAIAGLFCAMQAGEARLTFHGTWAIDGASVWARLLILAATAFTVLLGPAWFRTDRRHGEYYAMLLLSALGAMALAGAADLLQLLIAVLLSSVTGYVLAAYHRDWALSVEAGMKYFLIGALASAVLTIGITILIGMLGSSGYTEIARALETSPAPPLILLGTALVVIGIGFKLAAAPAHSWMPDVAEGAPVPSAAFLTVVPKIGAAIALARFVGLFPPDAVAIRPLVAILAFATMTLGNLAALWQEDVRRLLGWSSVSQSGYALMAVCVVGLSGSALDALLVFLAAYAAANLAAFAVVAHLRGRTERASYGGLAAARPAAAAVLVVALLSLVGIPPLAGFFGKLALFAATIDGGYAWLAVAAVANTVLSLFYYLRVIAPAYFAAKRESVPVLARSTAFAAGLGGLAVLGFGLILGIVSAGVGGTMLIP
jgi:NADH-quinone oxidoreductase subunit N